MTNEPAVGKCEGCGHIRYPEDLFDGDCVVCCLWAVNQLAAEKQRGDELQFTLDGRELSLKQVDDAYASLTARVRELEGVLEKIAITAGINTAHMEKEYVVGSLENCRAVAREALDAEKGGE